MVRKLSHWLPPLILLIITIAFAFRPNFDADFGWHYRTGEYIWQHRQIPQTDIFSYSLPNHPYIDHTWLTDIFLYHLYNSFGFNGISLFYGTLLAVALHLGSLVVTKNPWHQFLLRLLTLVLYPFALISIGLRTQVVTFLGLAIVLRLTETIKTNDLFNLRHKNFFLYYLNRLNTPRLAARFAESRRARPSPSIAKAKEGKQEGIKTHQLINLLTNQLLLLPLLFLLWANLHAGFVIGLGLLALQFCWLVYQTQTKDRVPVAKTLGLVYLACVAVTVINPYGLKLHQLIFTMVRNNTAAHTNLDWVPYLQNEIFSTQHKLITFAWVGLIVIWLKKYWNRRLLTGLFLVLALGSTRYLLPLALVLLTTTPALLDQIADRLGLKHKSRRPLVVIPTLLFCLWYGSTLLGQINRTLWIHQSLQHFTQASINQGNYPFKPVLILDQVEQPLKIMNYYDWGGFLILNLPQHQVFIDGRMDNFFVNQTSFKAIHDQLMVTKPGWEELFAEYQPDAVLIPTIAPLAKALESQGWVKQYQDKYSTLLFSPELIPSSRALP